MVQFLFNLDIVAIISMAFEFALQRSNWRRFWLVAGIQTPARVETIDKIVVLEAGYAPNR